MTQKQDCGKARDKRRVAENEPSRQLGNSGEDPLALGTLFAQAFPGMRRVSERAIIRSQGKLRARSNLRVIYLEDDEG